MTVAVEGGEWSQHAPTHLTPGKDPILIVHEAGWAPRPVWTGRKSRPTGIRSPAVQPVVSRYTDWATRSSFIIRTITNCYAAKRISNTCYVMKAFNGTSQTVNFQHLHGSPLLHKTLTQKSPSSLQHIWWHVPINSYHIYDCIKTFFITL